MDRRCSKKHDCSDGLLEVDIGKASLRSKDIQIDTEYDDFIAQPMIIAGEAYLVTCVYIGKPYAIVFCDEIDTLPVERIGTLFEEDEKFLVKMNVVFVRIVDCSTLQIREWISGSGESYCVTGACAAIVAAVINTYCEYDSNINVRSTEDEVMIKYTQDGEIILTASESQISNLEIDMEI